MIAEETKLQFYLNGRKHANEFRKRSYSHLNKLEGGAKDDLLKKFGTLLVFDFEAAARLKAWDDLSMIIEVRTRPPIGPSVMLKASQECAVYGSARSFETLADIMLCSQSPEHSRSVLIYRITETLTVIS